MKNRKNSIWMRIIALALTSFIVINSVLTINATNDEGGDGTPKEISVENYQEAGGNGSGSGDSIVEILEQPTTYNSDGNGDGSGSGDKIDPQPKFLLRTVIRQRNLQQKLQRSL